MKHQEPDFRYLSEVDIWWAGLFLKSMAPESSAKQEQKRR